VPNSNQEQLKIWGRVNSVNVQKVLWCLCELDLAYERIDAGMAFGRNGEPEYLAMNPNGRIPTLVHGDFVLWESNSIMRYLVLAHAPQSPLYPQAPKLRASVDPVAGLDAFDPATCRAPGVLGVGANADRGARHGCDPERCRRRGR
jgi:glutathione S-transferase